MSSTLNKLRYRPDTRVYVVGAPASFEAELAAMPKGTTRAKALGKDLDLIHAFFTRKSEFERDIGRLKRALQPAGILWVSYPKGKGLGTDLNRDILRESAAKVGLEAVSLVAIDDAWSALRLKIVA